MNPKLELAKSVLLEINKGFATEKDVATVFQAVVDKLKEFRDALQSKVDEHKAETISKVDALHRSQERVAQNLQDHKAFTQSALETTSEALNGRIDTVAASIPPEADLTDLEDGLASLEERVAGIRIPDPNVLGIMRPYIEDLQGEIDNLKDKIEDVKKLAGKAGGSTIAYSRGQTKVYDLSNQLDGIKKTFALPAFWRVFSVQSTSTPQVFRPVVDYTTDASAMSITFTSGIDAISTLAAGQSLLVLYVEP